MKNILLLTTGGTIACQSGKLGLTPQAATVMASALQPLRRYYHIEIRDIMCLDSSNIRPAEWQTIAQTVFDQKDRYDGIVISHGTDTMAYTASALTFMLPGLDKPVVFTGSQVPLGQALSDGPDNLRTAFAMASSGMPGVFVAFDRKVMRGCRAVKVRASNFSAFESVNSRYIATVTSQGLTYTFPRGDTPGWPLLPLCGNSPPGGTAQAVTEVQRRNSENGRKSDTKQNLSSFCPHSSSVTCGDSFSPGEAIYTPSLKADLCTDVFLLKLTPGLSPAIFDALASLGYKGIVIEAFGLGGMNVLDRGLMGIEKAVKSGMSVVVTTQCLYDSADLQVYEVGNKLLSLGVIEGRDMTSEAAMTKLMWALGQGMTQQEISQIFTRSLAGEITV